MAHAARPSTSTGSREKNAATQSMARARSAVGAWSSVANPGHHDSTRPPTTPVARPSTVSGPAMGPATRLAGRAASGTEPNTGMRTGDTPICAAREEEADRVDEERVGEHEHDDREGEDPDAGSRATEVQRRHRARRHGAGA